MTIYEILIYFFIYGFLGWSVEVAFEAVRKKQFINRGFLNGPICPIYGVGVTLVILLLERYRDNVLLLFVASVVLVTLLEGVTGFVLEKVFHNKWWDYSKRPLNIGGYVCLLFSLIWGLACVLIVKYIHEIIEKGVHYIPRLTGNVMLIILGIIFCIDLLITAIKVTKMNKHLAYMEDIANELHNISDDIGEGVFEGVSGAMHLVAKTKEKWGGKTGNIEKHILELQKKYKEALERHEHDSKRLMKAFPNMISRHYKQALADTREHIKMARQNKSNKTGV